MNRKLVRLATIAMLSMLAALASTPVVAESESTPFIVMIGAPAAGKSTTSEMLTDMYGIPWLNVRNELLNEVKKEAKKGSSNQASRSSKRGFSQHKRNMAMKKAVENLEAGDLVSDDSLNALVASLVFSPDASSGFVLDGYPMTVAQAEFLDSLAESRGMAPLTIVYLNIPDEVALERMKERGRVDDKAGMGEARLKTFRTMIDTLIEYYGNESVNEIDGTMNTSEISAAISKLVEG